MMARTLVIAGMTACFVFAAGYGYAQSVGLNHVEGLVAPDSITAGDTIVFHLELSTGGYDVFGVSNGFRLYSPDSVVWGNTVPAWTDIVTDSMMSYRFAVPYAVSGGACDTVGFGGLYGSAGEVGLPSGFDEVIWTISLGPIDPQFEGKTVCIDSCFFPPGNRWKWQAGTIDGTAVYPAWDGPHCYTIVSTSCCANRGDVNHDGIACEIADLVDLSGYVNSGSPEPPCLAEADVNGSGGAVDTLDVYYLSDYMFSGGPAPVSCQ